ncbi:MAG TPA: hypothetical protein VK904_03255 [Miltoncostaeaceae bacterium]|nr:hypothetical protein [Miltoncostaeaceae bacterium]
MWELRRQLTPGDASYLALAEGLADALLLTGDAGLGRLQAGEAEQAQRRQATVQSAAAASTTSARPCAPPRDPGA